MCQGGLKEKFKQNKDLQNLLISTSGQTLVEASWDHNWGCGLSITDDQILYCQCWYSQGLLGELLEEIRDNFMKGDNSDDDDEWSTRNNQEEMDTLPGKAVTSTASNEVT